MELALAVVEGSINEVCRITRLCYMISICVITGVR